MKTGDSLKRSEQLYRTLFENSDDGFMLVEPIYSELGEACDIRFLKLNAAFERQTGAKAADVLGRKASEVVPELEPTIISLSGKVAKSGKTTHKETYDKYSNKWYDSQLIPFAEGQVGILFRDINERKKAEETLEEAEEKFKNMIEQSPDVFGLYDKDCFLIQVNMAWENLWEIPRELAIGKWNPLKSKQVRDIGWVPLIKKAYAGETVDVPETEFDPSLEPLTMGKGRKRWIKSIIYPIKNIEGEIQNVVMMHQDITDRKLLEKQLQDKERMAVIGQTAGMVGHDIRNPLQAIVSELFLAKQVMSEAPKSKDVTEVLESINMIQEQADYINKIVSDLQDYARPLSPEYATVDLSDLIVSVFDTIPLQDKIKIKVDIQGAIKLETDPTFIKRSLGNLINNAIQAMPDGGELGLTAQKQENSVVITVSDTGKGIPESVRASLFTPLVTTKSKGQGLGLAVVKRLVEGLNGRVSFESEEGKGTKFKIELPFQS